MAGFINISTIHQHEIQTAILLTSCTIGGLLVKLDCVLLLFFFVLHIFASSTNSSALLVMTMSLIFLISVIIVSRVLLPIIFKCFHYSKSHTQHIFLSNN